MAKNKRNRRELRRLRPDTLPRELRCDLDNCPSNLHGERGQYLLSLCESDGPMKIEAHCRSCGANFVFSIELPRRLYTRQAVGELLGVAPVTVDRLVKAGELESMKLGEAKNSPVRFEPGEILRYLEARRNAS